MIKQIVLCFVVAIAMTTAGWFILPATVEVNYMFITLVLTFVFSFLEAMFTGLTIETAREKEDWSLHLFLGVIIPMLLMSMPYVIVLTK